MKAARGRKEKKMRTQAILLKSTGAIQIEKPQNHERCHGGEEKLKKKKFFLATAFNERW